MRESDPIRDAIVHLAGEEGEQLSAHRRLQPFLGIVDSGGKQLSTRTGERVREILQTRRRSSPRRSP
jgi:hypothetical protein